MDGAYDLAPDMPYSRCAPCLHLQADPWHAGYLQSISFSRTCQSPFQEVGFHRIPLSFHPKGEFRQVNFKKEKSRGIIHGTNGPKKGKGDKIRKMAPCFRLQENPCMQEEEATIDLLLLPSNFLSNILWLTSIEPENPF